MLPVTVGNDFGPPAVKELSAPLSYFFNVFNILKFHPVKADIIFGNRQKSFRAKSREEWVFNVTNRFLGQKLLA
jgi:hypothetical protein